MSHPEMLGKQLSNDLDVGHGGRITSTPVMAATPNPFSTRSGSNFRPPNSVFDSNGTDSVIDLKLERLADHGDAIDLAFTKGAPMLSSSMPQKRVRASGLGSQIVFCQVYGCNKDLSSGKDYHKRHRVCEVHSKTATVIVKGIQQRFCQQCSRFHLLAEFDDGKRSCRKRLAGHNERRRKPQTGIHTGKGGRLLQPCGDSRFQGGMLNSSSYIGQAMLPSGSGVMPSEEYGMNGLWGPNKAEHGTSFRHICSIPNSNEHSQSRSLFPSYNQKQFPFLHENSATSTIGSICDNNIQYPLVVGSQNSVSRSIFHRDTSIGCEDFNVFETTSSVQGLSEISDSFALSLLSSQSQKSSNQSSRIPLAHPLFIPSSHNNHYNMSPVSETIGISSHTSLSRVSNRFPSEMDPVDGIHLNPVLIPDNDDDEIVNFEMANGIFQGSDFTNMKDHRLSCEDGATIDLLQLSSQLQQVEHERQCLQVKQENDSFCTLRST